MTKRPELARAHVRMKVETTGYTELVGHDRTHALLSPTLLNVNFVHIDG
jgi:alpha-D-ribose 1-methylphosphonate 5-triphosphate synthase subunit PhnG